MYYTTTVTYEQVSENKGTERKREFSARTKSRVDRVDALS